MRYRFIQQHRHEYRIWLMCGVLEVSRGGFYLWLKRPASPRSVGNCRHLLAIRAMYRASHGAYGSPRVHAQLRALSQNYGKNRIARIMRENRIQAKRKFRVTTDSKHNFPVSENVLDRKFDIKAPNKAWTADITYRRKKAGFTWPWLWTCIPEEL